MHRQDGLARALVWFAVVGGGEALVSQMPYGVHLAFGREDGEMLVMWHTEVATASSTVEYAPLGAGEAAYLATPSGDATAMRRENPLARRLLLSAAGALPLSAEGDSFNFTDQGAAKAVQARRSSLQKAMEGSACASDNGQFVYSYADSFCAPGIEAARRERGGWQVLHRVTLRGLQAGQAYKYHVGSANGWSTLFTFTAKRSPTQIRKDKLRVVAYCDMGDVHASPVLADVQEDVQTNPYDFLLHCGDLAYDFWKADGQVGVDFMKEIESVAAYLPYMVSPGNHEQAYNFSHYVHYFSMPDWERSQNMFYSYDVGNAHIVSYNTEVYFFPQSWDITHMQRQFEWLEHDLREANKPENRAERPWIIITGHRPMYCVVPTPDGRCDAEHEASRLGLPTACQDDTDAHNCLAMSNPLRTFPIEDLLYEYGVDLAIYGHIHDYERFFPVYNLTLSNDPDKDPYNEPKATVHITTGAGGNPEMPYGDKPPPQGNCHFTKEHWCAFQSGYFPTNGQSADFTYSHLTIHNDTHLNWRQYSSTLKRVIDEFWIVQRNHGCVPYNIHVKCSTTV